MNFVLQMVNHADDNPVCGDGYIADLGPLRTEILWPRQCRGELNETFHAL
jgi:hypothetical protein